MTAYWAAVTARDWMAPGAVLAGDVHYEAPQTRELLRGRPDRADHRFLARAVRAAGPPRGPAERYWPPAPAPAKIVP
ncbi:MAG: hypothetical protein ACLPQY_33720 [Streptosporangiaceae bacterium]